MYVSLSSVCVYVSMYVCVCVTSTAGIGMNAWFTPTDMSVRLVCHVPRDQNHSPYGPTYSPYIYKKPVRSFLSYICISSLRKAEKRRPRIWICYLSAPVWTFFKLISTVACRPISNANTHNFDNVRYTLFLSVYSSDIFIFHLDSKGIRANPLFFIIVLFNILQSHELKKDIQ